jgi:hypothetical protein
MARKGTGTLPRDETMTTTLTPNLKLRIDSKLTANAKYNLQQIDLLGATFLVDSTSTLKIRSQTDLVIEPNSADIGGSGLNGSVFIGTANHKIAALNVYATELYLDGAFNLKDQASTSTGKLGLVYKSDLNGSLDNTARVLNIDVDGASRNLVLGGNLSLLGGNLILNVTGSTNVILPQSGTLSTLDGAETLTNKSIDADQNTLTNIANASIKVAAGIEYSKLNLVNSIINADINSAAAIAYSKLNLSSSIVNADINVSAAIAYSKLNLATSIVNTDISLTADIAYSKLDLEDSILDGDIAPGAAIQGTKILPQFGAQNIRTTGVLELANGAYTTALAHASSGQSQDLTFKLPNSYGSSLNFLQTDGAGNLQWSASTGTGTVTSVDLSASGEFSVSGGPITTSGTLVLTKTNQSANQVWAGPTSGVAAQPSFRALVLADLPLLSSADVGLGNVPNVDATNPANITQSASYRFVTDTEKSTWNGKQDALGFTPENSANRGIANGYAPLNASGKLENSYLNTSVMNYHGTWDASTNTPALADGMIGADPGDIYIVSVAGTQNLGSGSITFGVDDWVIYSQTNVWQRVANSNAVASVNGATGAVTVNAINELTGDVTAGPASGSESKVATIASGAVTDAKISASAAVSVSKLAAGTNGYVLQTVAGVPTWTTPPVSVQSYKTNWVTADGTTKVITHGLGTADVLIQIYNLSSFERIDVDTITIDSTTATLVSSQAPLWTWRVLILAI